MTEASTPRSGGLTALDDALAQLLAAARARPPLQLERLPTPEALGRVLGEDLIAAVDVPPLDNSAMDGYALRAADVPAVGTALPISQRIQAGQVGAALAPGSAARIFTGAPIPEGADAVVMQEHTQAAGEGAIAFLRPVTLGQNVRRRGEDIAAGQTVLAAGSRLTPAALGVAASVGAARLVVKRRLRVALLCSGDELIEPGQPLPPGAIYNSNRYTLRALITAAGCECMDLGAVPDDLAATVAALRTADDADLIVSSGGVSVGEADHLRQALEQVGQLALWKLAIKPGKPLAFGHVFGQIAERSGKGALYLGLPGNPVASFVTFLVMVAPVLRALQGMAQVQPRAIATTAAFDWPKPDSRREFLRARLSAHGQAELYAHQGSGVLTSVQWADGLIDNPPGQAIAAGDAVRFLPLSELIGA